MYAYRKTPTLSRVGRYLLRHKWSVLLVSLIVWQFGQAGYIHAKAVVAQWMIASAWQQSLQTGQPQAPWAWADTWPVAKLHMQGQDIYVLQGVSGRTLAFGPGHLSYTAKPGEAGNIAIVGHRDTHFAMLEKAQTNEEIELQSPSGLTRYRVTETRILHESQMQVVQNNGQNSLTLITCYPFNGISPNTEYRYVVRALAVDAQST